MVEILSYRRTLYASATGYWRILAGFSFIFVQGVINGKEGKKAALPKFSGSTKMLMFRFGFDFISTKISNPGIKKSKLCIKKLMES